MNIYMIRNKSTGKFVNDLSNPKHKFWKYRKMAEIAIARCHGYKDQYTGLNDVKGKEIYEGDIVKCKYYDFDGNVSKYIGKVFYDYDGIETVQEKHRSWR